MDFVIEGKALVQGVKKADGKVELQQGYDWTGSGQLLFLPSSDKSNLELDFSVEKEEYKGLVLRFTNSDDYGIYRVFLDGRNIADYERKDWLVSLDFYSENLEVKDVYLGSLLLTKGKHAVRFESAGRNPHSKGMLLGLDSIRLRERWNKKRALLRK